MNSEIKVNILIPIPIREDLVVQIKNVPIDLTHNEALKISNIIKAYPTVQVMEVIKEKE